MREPHESEKWNVVFYITRQLPLRMMWLLPCLSYRICTCTVINFTVDMVLGGIEVERSVCSIMLPYLLHYFKIV